MCQVEEKRLVQGEAEYPMGLGHTGPGWPAQQLSETSSSSSHSLNYVFPSKTLKWGHTAWNASSAHPGPRLRSQTEGCPVLEYSPDPSCC